MPGPAKSVRFQVHPGDSNIGSGSVVTPVIAFLAPKEQQKQPGLPQSLGHPHPSAHRVERPGVLEHQLEIGRTESLLR